MAASASPLGDFIGLAPDAGKVHHPNGKCKRLCRILWRHA